MSPTPETAWRDPSPHKVRFVSVDKGVRLEVLEWGDSGQPVVLLAGLGCTAHIFDDFAQKLSVGCHVYGITQRGFGLSSAPESGYTTERLSKDVLRVLSTLKIKRPVLVGHSIAGEELTALGNQHSDQIGGLVYLDGAIDRTDARVQTVMREFPSPPIPTASDLRTFEALQAFWRRTFGITLPLSELRNEYYGAPDGSVGRLRTSARIGQAILAGIQKPDYARIRVPVLAIYALPGSPHDAVPWTTDARTEAIVDRIYPIAVATAKDSAEALSRSVPDARIVVLRPASHFVFLSNESDVLREIHVFLSRLRNSGER